MNIYTCTYMIKCTILTFFKCTFQWHYVDFHCSATTTVHSKMILPSQAETAYPLNSHPSFSSLKSWLAHYLTLCLYKFDPLDSFVSEIRQFVSFCVQFISPSVFSRSIHVSTYTKLLSFILIFSGVYIQYQIIFIHLSTNGHSFCFF